MISNARTAMKFFVYGLLLGLLFAPRSGEETRQELLGWITGTVQDSNGKPLAGVIAALVPDAPRRDQYQLYLTSNTTDGGAFSFLNIRPGDYKVFLLPESDVEGIQNPAFLAQNESRGTSIRLAEGKAENIQLTFAQ